MTDVLDDVLTLPDGRRLGYRVRGDRSGRPILYFHGQPGSRMEVEVIPDDVLVRAGAFIIGFDRPGMGRSDLVPARDMLLDLPDAIALLDHLEVARAGVIGVSAGGPWAFAFAATYPERAARLVPSSASGPYDDETYMHDADIDEQRDLRERGAAALLADYEAARTRILGDVHAAMVEWFGDYPSPEDEWATRGVGWDVLALDIPESMRQGGRGWLRETEVRGLAWSFDPAAIRCPVRAFHGERDSLERLDNLRRIIALIPDASVTVYPGGDHLSPLLHPERLVAAATSAD